MPVKSIWCKSRQVIMSLGLLLWSSEYPAGGRQRVWNSNKNKLIPRYFNDANNTIALRVSNHKPIKDLLAIFNNLMVSTSANISNLPTPVNQEEVMKIFTDPDVAIYCFEQKSQK